jgi:hypothetical protein
VFSGGPLVPAAAIGLLGLAATAGRAFMGGARVALFSYLVAFAYWLGIALGALLMVMILRASKARWAIVGRRAMEVMAATLTIFPILFLPIAFGINDLYPWAAPTEALGEEALRLLHHRAVYLNPTFFFIRAGIYFFVWILFSRLFLYWSTRQDHQDEPKLTQRAWTLGAGGLPLVALTLTFAAVDWLMSLGVFYFSSMWGVYYFAGSFVAFIALLILLLNSLQKTESLADVLKTAHWLSFGKLLLAFTCFWAYIAYSQYMLVWVANLPDTIPFILLRNRKGWSFLGWVLVIGHFIVPFLVLLTRWVKMKPQRLAVIATWILVIHYVDLYWVVMPQVRPDEVMLDWSNITALIGVGGVAFAFGTWLLRGRHALAVGDPFLAESLHYEKML